MLPPADASLLDEAVALVRRAGDLTLRWFGSGQLSVERKADGTPVTDADRAAERLLRDELSGRHPGDGIVGEEEGISTGNTGRRWIIDPIDGTKAFTHGVPLYSNLLTFEDEHGPAIGVINLPALGETVYAGRGLGCFHDGATARVSTRATLDDAYLMTSGFDGWPPDALAAVHASPMKLRTWGDGYGYALVATGRAEAMVDTEASVWDLAPMLVIIHEAGGRFTDFNGAAISTGGTGLGTNGLVHDSVLALLAPRAE